MVHDVAGVTGPRGDTALLTGENGSGKSTLVDALLTLLVPNQKRNYNQASGAAARRERNELTYVRGAYAKLRYYPPTGGSSTLNQTVHRDEILEHSARLLTHIGWQANPIPRFFVPLS